MFATKYIILVLGHLSMHCCLDLSMKLAKIESSINCRTDRDCKENEFCWNNDANREGKCKCQDDFLPRTNVEEYECLPVANNIGAKCVDNIQCHMKLSTLSMCDLQNSGTCQCKSEAHFVDNQKRCYSTSKLGELCKVHENCKMNGGKFATCVAGKCSCNFGEHPSSDNTRCVSTSQLGDRCTVSESCVEMNARCIDGVCKCKEGFVVANDETQCLPAATDIGDRCVQNSQCTKTIRESSCISGTCQCDDGKHLIGNTCFTDKFAGERCALKEECLRTSALENAIDCIRGVCTCTLGQSEGLYGCLLDSGSSETSRLALWTVCSLVVFYLYRFTS